MARTVESDDARNPAQAGPADVITTGVAKGRDRLDSATSTSVLREADIAKIGAALIGDLLRDVPGIRSEADGGDGAANISIRGLPIATTGAKFIQLQEDGLPILEFGDILGWGADSFVRADLNLAQVEVIRGGSASTFASNSPGGIINFISKTGEVDGGAIALSSASTTTCTAPISIMARMSAIRCASMSAASSAKAKDRAGPAMTPSRAGRSS